jgi:hypothetical protein
MAVAYWNGRGLDIYVGSRNGAEQLLIAVSGRRLQLVTKKVP